MNKQKLSVSCSSVNKNMFMEPNHSYKCVQLFFFLVDENLINKTNLTLL